AGTGRVSRGAPGPAKPRLTNTLFCVGGCSAAPRPMSDPADGFTMRSRITGVGCGMMVREFVVFWLGVSEVCALPDTVVATNANATQAVRKWFIDCDPALPLRAKPASETEVPIVGSDGTLRLQRTLASWSSRTSLLPSLRYACLAETLNIPVQLQRVLDVKEPLARKAPRESRLSPQKLCDGNPQFLLPLHVPKRSHPMGKGPVVTVWNPNGSLRPPECSVEVPREDLRERPVRVERPALGIVGAEVDRPLEMRDGLAVAAFI